jgi:heme/copper-type cytochrome/quinol oxidase subunit 4
MEENISPEEPQNEGTSAAEITKHEPFKGARWVAAVVYVLSIVFTLICMIGRHSSFYTFKDFIEWLLVFLAITFAVWLVAFLFVRSKEHARGE